VDPGEAHAADDRARALGDEKGNLALCLLLPAINLLLLLASRSASSVARSSSLVSSSLSGTS
jgi:hypothetical protein